MDATSNRCYCALCVSPWEFEHDAIMPELPARYRNDDEETEPVEAGKPVLVNAH